MKWQDILKMMTPREFMTEVINHIGGGEIEDKSLKTGGKLRAQARQSIKMTAIHNNRKYRILFDSSMRANPKQQYIFNYQKGAGDSTLISIKGYSLKKMLETFKQEWNEDSNIENLAPLAAALVGTAAQAGKTMMEKGDEEFEKLNFNVKSLTSGDGFKNAVRSGDGGTKPTSVPKDAQQSFNRLRRKPQ